MTWWELGLAVFGWTLLSFGLFHLGRLWERDHAKSEIWMPSMLDESWEVKWDIPVRRGPYTGQRRVVRRFRPARSPSSAWMMQRGPGRSEAPVAPGRLSAYPRVCDERRRILPRPRRQESRVVTVGWVRLDDGFALHPKVVTLSVEARWSYIEGLCYAAKYETDGHLPDTIAANGHHRESLVKAGLWDETPEGVLTHDYLEYNPSKEQKGKQASKQTLSRCYRCCYKVWYR